MTRYTILFFIVFLIQNLTAQVDLAGIINEYTAVTAIENDSCQSQITVADASVFEIGDAVVLIQMQGAQIVENNSSAFGDIANLNSAGLYEIQQIKSIVGQDIFFEKQFVNNYEIDGKVQLINMPTYQDAQISNTLTADAWNGATGGVLALQVDGQLQMNADIDVSNLGFRGGQKITTTNNNCSWLFQHTNYSYDFGNWRSSAKGEGISAIIIGKEFGKGAQANGGGGGNDHNTGGGGGGNISNGGIGGNNNESGAFDCQGNHPGIGGKGISDNTGRLFMGGGGGSGQGNNGAATSGGNGGGIVILIVNELTPNDFSIKSNGENVMTGNGDGGGGGGAAGTFLLEVQNLSSTLNFETLGGNGGVIDNNFGDKCFGPGGGGSGGRILTNLTTADPLTTQISGGLAGSSINSSDCPDGTNGAQNGMDGIFENLNLIPFANEDFPFPLANFSFDLNGTIVSFSNQSQNANSYTWDFGDGNSDNSDNPTHTYNQGGIYNVQLIVTNGCGMDTITQTVETIAPPIASFGTETGTEGCAPWTIDFSEMASGTIDSYLWTFDGGTPSTSTDPNPNIVYETPGIYEVTLEVFGPGGSDSITIENFVTITFPTIADFDYTINESIVTFQNLSSNTTEIVWNFGDGTPATNNPNPIHQYDTAGVYVVTLTAFSDFCDSMISQTITLDFTSVEDLENLGLNIFPNPASDWLTIENEGNELTRLKIYGIDGKELPKLSRDFSQNINLDIRGLPSGIYILNLFQGEKLGRFRLVKL